MPKTLLLADDSVTIQRVIELSFAHEDIRVVSVSDGKRAVQWMDSEWPDIVLVDVEVPELDGYAVASHVKKTPRLQKVPVLLLAGAFEPVDEKRAAAIGCEGVLVKPFEPQQLVSRVKELLAASPAKSGGRKAAAAMAVEALASATVTPFPATSSRSGDEGPFRVMHGSPFDSDGAPESLEPPARPVWDTSGGASALMNSVPARGAEAAGTAPKVSLVNAFSALLAAEQSTTPAPSAAAAPGMVSDATVEDAVRRVLSRMTDDLVRRIVVETAERLIKEEIQKIKDNPE